MFVISVLDNGEERNFIARNLRVADGVIAVDVGGMTHIFQRADLIDIVSVNDAVPPYSKSPLAWGLVVN